jgi:hypothetical protein
VQIRQYSKTKFAPNFTRLTISVACAALVCTGAFAVPSAYAQSTGANQVNSLETPPSYDAQTLQSFAKAATMVLGLRSAYYPRIRAAELASSNEKAKLLFTEMRQHMNTAIRKAGFSEEQYLAISNAAKTDAVLRQQINTIIQGPSPAQQHIKNVARVTPKAPQIAAAPSNTAPAPTNVAPATPAAAPVAPAAPNTAATPVDDGARQRLEVELRKTNAERDLYQAEQIALQEKVQQLEGQLSIVKAQDSALRQQLSANKKQALAEQKKSKAELETLQGEVTNLKDEMTIVQSQDSSLRELLEAETIRADSEKSAKEAKLAAFREEIKRLAGSLAIAQQSLSSVALDLQPGENGSADQRTPAFEALTPLHKTPNSIERVLEKTQPQYAKRQELDGEIARIQQERARREAEYTNLQQEIAALSLDLAATYQAMAELIEEPANITVATTNLDIQNDTYALDVSQETALLFAGIAPQFDQTLADPQASILLDEPLALDSGDPGLEQSAHQPADSAALEPGTITPLRLNSVPVVQIATAPTPAATAPEVVEPASPSEDAPWEFSGLSAAEPEISIATVQPLHQIVRDENEFNPASYPNSVTGGANAYKDAEYRRAYEIWAPLADSGNRAAQFHLGALYLEGRGTGIDFHQAYFWLRLASRRGDERALSLIPVVAEKLTIEEIRASEDRARDWLQKRSIKVTQSDRSSENSL